MRKKNVQLICSALAGVALLSACGQNEDSAPASDATENEAAEETAVEDAGIPEGMTAQGMSDLRHEKLENVGDAFKAISDQLRSDSPDVAAIQTAVASIPPEVEGMADWFPAGTGPDDGVDTDALAAIWENKADFLEKESNFQAALVELSAAADGGNVAAIGEAFKKTGGTCKACHDDYRKDD